MKTIFFISFILLVGISSASRILAAKSSNQTMNSLCKNWDKQNNVCLQCFQGCTLWESICVKIVKHCSKWDNQGNCTNCQMSYGDMEQKPINGSCPIQMTTQNQTAPGLITIDNMTIDLNCQCHNDKRDCIDCFAGFYLDLDNICTELPQNCTAASPQGNCTKCIPGFTVENGQCAPQQCDLGMCRTFNSDQTQCTSCPKRAYLKDGCCLQVSGYCAQWVATTGECTKCYVGYVIDKNNNKDCIPQSTQ